MHSLVRFRYYIAWCKRHSHVEYESYAYHIRRALLAIAEALREEIELRPLLTWLGDWRQNEVRIRTRYCARSINCRFIFEQWLRGLRGRPRGHMTPRAVSQVELRLSSSYLLLQHFAARRCRYARAECAMAIKMHTVTISVRRLSWSSGTFDGGYCPQLLFRFIVNKESVIVHCRKEWKCIIRLHVKILAAELYIEGRIRLNKDVLSRRFKVDVLSATEREFVASGFTCVKMHDEFEILKT